MFMLCGASVIVYDFLLYQGSTTELSDVNKATYGITGAVVMHLAERIPSKQNHVMFFDNYFTSIPVLRALLDKGMYAAGTIRNNRTQTCPLNKEKKLKAQGRGSIDCLVTKAGKIALTRWMDNGTVTLASNYVAVEDEDTVSKWSKAEKRYIDVTWPAVIRDYNCCMGRVDKTNFLLSLHRTNIQSRKWSAFSLCKSSRHKLLAGVQG